MLLVTGLTYISSLTLLWTLKILLELTEMFLQKLCEIWRYVEMKYVLKEIFTLKNTP